MLRFSTASAIVAAPFKMVVTVKVTAIGSGAWDSHRVRVRAMSKIRVKKR